MTPADHEPDGEDRPGKRERRLDALIRELLHIRASAPPATDEEIRRHRHEGRP